MSESMNNCIEEVFKSRPDLESDYSLSSIMVQERASVLMLAYGSLSALCCWGVASAVFIGRQRIEALKRPVF
jgi:hypothetical protein